MSELIANRYELGSVVGSGGMSVVYSATDTLLGREVAVKMLRSELARDANFRERFRREAQNAGRLNHPAIVAIYDTGETLHDGQSTPYIVMELVKGRNLKDIVADGGPLSPDEAATTLIPVCEALQVSHDAGIVHRDIKPANVMITNTGVVKIMDFGIARALDDVTSHMTQTSAVIGTAQYLSPEQARGKPVDGRSDLYALGCLMYDIMVGHPPFDGDTPFAVAYQHVQEDPTPPSEFIPDLSPTAALNVDAVVLTAMAKHPGDRYQTAVEMAADLQRLEKNLVTMAARQYVDHDPEGAASLPGPAGIAAAELAAAGGAGAAGLAGAAGAAGAAGTAALGSGLVPPMQRKPQWCLRCRRSFLRGRHHQCSRVGQRMRHRPIRACPRAVTRRVAPLVNIPRMRPRLDRCSDTGELSWMRMIMIRMRIGRGRACGSR